LIDYSYSRKKNSSVLYPQGIVSNILVQPLMTTLFSNNQQLISPRFRHDNMHLKSLISDGNWNYIQYAVAKRLRRETSILVTVNLVIFTSIWNPGLWLGFQWRLLDAQPRWELTGELAGAMRKGWGNPSSAKELLSTSTSTQPSAAAPNWQVRSSTVLLVSSKRMELILLNPEDIGTGATIW
jgi:hypothetical protein